MVFSSNVLKGWSFQKDCTRIRSFLHYLERWYFFFGKHGFFFFGRKMKDELYEEIHGNMIFSVCTYRCYKCDTTLLCQKNQRWSYPAKIHLKVIDIQIGILEGAPIIPYTFMETFIDVFIYCFPAKKTGNLTYSIDVWLLPQFIRLEIYYNEKYSILCTIQSSGVVFGGVPERQSRKLFVH